MMNDRQPQQPPTPDADAVQDARAEGVTPSVAVTGVPRGNTTGNALEELSSEGGMLEQKKIIKCF